MSDSVTQKVRVRLEQPFESTTVISLIDDKSSKDDENDSNRINLTNVSERSPSPISFSTQQFATTTSAIDILHSIIQETTES